MFVWTPASVLRALDAGIAEVASVYNRTYTEQVRLIGPRGGAAHDASLALVTAQANRGEQRIDEHHVDLLFEALDANASPTPAAADTKPHTGFCIAWNAAGGAQCRCGMTFDLIR